MLSFLRKAHAYIETIRSVQLDHFAIVLVSLSACKADIPQGMRQVPKAGHNASMVID